MESFGTHISLLIPLCIVGSLLIPSASAQNWVNCDKYCPAISCSEYFRESGSVWTECIRSKSQCLCSGTDKKASYTYHFSISGIFFILFGIAVCVFIGVVICVCCRRRSGAGSTQGAVVARPLLPSHPPPPAYTSSPITNNSEVYPPRSIGFEGNSGVVDPTMTYGAASTSQPAMAMPMSPETAHQVPGFQGSNYPQH